jgi:hypothetical protein
MSFIRPIREFRTIRQLLEGAERVAHDSGEELPGAEHLLMAALALPDGTATGAFGRLGVDPEGLPGAIRSQHADALRAVGIDPGEAGPLEVPVPDGRGVFRATPAGQAAFRRAVELSGTSKPRRLLGAHVVVAVCEMEHGTVARSLRHLGVDREELAAAARVELDRIRT